MGTFIFAKLVDCLYKNVIEYKFEKIRRNFKNEILIKLNTKTISLEISLKNISEEISEEEQVIFLKLIAICFSNSFVVLPLFKK